MFLRHLTLRNVRSIKELELDFSSPDDSTKIRQWTLLLAENGTGKTCVLRSIGLLLAGFWASVPNLMADIDSWIRNGASEALMEVVIDKIKGGTLTISLRLNRGMNANEFFKHNAEALGLIDSFGKNSETVRCFVAGYGASRRLPGGSSSIAGGLMGHHSKLEERAQGLASLFLPNAELNSLQSWAMDLDYQRGNEGLAILRSALDALLPGVTFESIDKANKELLFKTADGLVPLSRLSDGYQSMAGWIGDLLFRITQTFPDLQNPLMAHGLLLLDEMDLHLHPVWQRQLMAFLTERLPNFQIIATTHSPLTAQQAGPGELHLLERPSPKLPPVLRRFDGTPRHMRLEDLAIGPWFGLNTGYSLEVERLRTDYEKSKSKRSSAKAKLESLPVSNGKTEFERQNQVLVEKLNQIIESHELVTEKKLHRVMKRTNGTKKLAKRSKPRRALATQK